MNTGADVSYLLKAREALNESEKAERDGDWVAAIELSNACISYMGLWGTSIAEKEAA